MPGFSRSPRETTTVGGRWTMTPGRLGAGAPAAGAPGPGRLGTDTPTQFDPDRVRPKDAGAYRPFGTGERSCIGRQFALHEAVLVLARLLHRFDIAGDPSYHLSITERLTLMPEALELTLTARRDAARPARSEP